MVLHRATEKNHKLAKYGHWKIGGEGLFMVVTEGEIEGKYLHGRRRTAEIDDARRCRLQNVNGGHSGTLAFYFCPFWGACRQVTRACRQDYFLWSIFNYTEKS